MSSVFSYGRAGFVDNYNGRDWFGHENCPYCATKLVELGSFHQNARNVMESKGQAFCCHCFVRNIPWDHSRRSDVGDDGINLHYPLHLTPARDCLMMVAQCANCGWWFAIENNDGCNDGYAVSYSGILQTFDLQGMDIPVDILKAELAKNIKFVFELHPHKMEYLVADVLRGVYDCEVHQLSYSKDKGIDLIILLSDNPVAVQIKRRSSEFKVEGVSGVREFLGAALLRKHKNLMYVSTAGHFTKGAKEEAKEAVDQQLINSYELISLDKFNSLLCEVQSNTDAWRLAFESAVKKKYTIPQVLDPFTILQRANS